MSKKKSLTVKRSRDDRFKWYPLPDHLPPYFVIAYYYYCTGRMNGKARALLKSMGIKIDD